MLSNLWCFKVGRYVSLVIKYVIEDFRGFIFQYSFGSNEGSLYYILSSPDFSLCEFESKDWVVRFYCYVHKNSTVSLIFSFISGNIKFFFVCVL